MTMTTATASLLCFFVISSRLSLTATHMKKRYSSGQRLGWGKLGGGTHRKKQKGREPQAIMVVLVEEGHVVDLCEFQWFYSSFFFLQHSEASWGSAGKGEERSTRQVPLWVPAVFVLIYILLGKKSY